MSDSFSCSQGVLLAVTAYTHSEESAAVNNINVDDNDEPPNRHAYHDASFNACEEDDIGQPQIRAL